MTLKKEYLQIYMNDSTSSENLKISYLNKNNKKVKNGESTDTDLYLNLIANDNKTLQKESSLSSEISISDNQDNDKNTSSININKVKSIKSSSSYKSSKSSKSSKSTNSSSSKPKYDKINLNNNKEDSNINNNNTDNKYNSFRKHSVNRGDLRMRKIELLRRLSELKTKGYELSKNYDFNSTIDEMEYEYELMKSFADKRNGIKLYKNILLNVTSVVEFLNDKYDPFNFKLSGWSEHMSVECDSYEDVLEQLYEKYRGNGKNMGPELKLFLLVLASASAFHFSKATYQNTPMVDGFLKKNPGFVANIINPKKENSQFMSQQEINLEKQKELFREKERSKRSINKNVNNNLNNSKQNDIQNMQNNNQNNRNNFQKSNQNKNTFNRILEKDDNKDRINIQNEERIFDNSIKIAPPENVDDILKRLHQRTDNVIGNTTQEESSNNNDRIIEDSSLTSDTQGKKVKRKTRKKKSIMTVL